MAGQLGVSIKKVAEGLGTLGRKSMEGADSAVNTVVLWGAILVMVLYPLATVVAATFAPAFPDSQSLRLADFLSERFLTASVNTLRLGMAMSFLSLLTGAAFALLAAQSPRERWSDLVMSVPFLTPPFLASLAWSLVVGSKGWAVSACSHGAGPKRKPQPISVLPWQPLWTAQRFLTYG